MTKHPVPGLERRKRAARGAFKTVEEVVKKMKNVRLRAHPFDSAVLPASTFDSETGSYEGLKNTMWASQRGIEGSTLGVSNLKWFLCYQKRRGPLVIGNTLVKNHEVASRSVSHLHRHSSLSALQKTNESANNKVVWPYAHCVVVGQNNCKEKRGALRKTEIRCEGSMLYWPATVAYGCMYIPSYFASFHSYPDPSRNPQLFVTV